jgi:hypothetical protein
MHDIKKSTSPESYLFRFAKGFSGRTIGFFCEKTALTLDIDRFVSYLIKVCVVFKIIFFRIWLP